MFRSGFARCKCFLKLLVCGAWSKDADRELLGRVLLNEYIVFYRKEDGTPVALENRCPHRNLPLSEGKLVGDDIECGYHGMIFNCDGNCIHLPGSETAPTWATVKRYPVAERNGWLFYWPGDPSKADEALLPDYHQITKMNTGLRRRDKPTSTLVTVWF